MNIKVFATVDFEKDVSISVEDITAALMEIEDETREMIEHPGATPRNKAFAIKQFVTAAWQCLSGVTDEMIILLSDEARNNVADALEKQASRFRVGE